MVQSPVPGEFRSGRPGRGIAVSMIGAGPRGTSTRQAPGVRFRPASREPRPVQS